MDKKPNVTQANSYTYNKNSHTKNIPSLLRISKGLTDRQKERLVKHSK